MFNPLPLVRAELKRTFAGAAAVILLIAVATALGIAISSQERAIKKGSTAAAYEFDILIGAPGSPTQLVLSTIYLQLSPARLISGSILKDLQKDEGVEFAAPIAFGDHYGPYLIIGTTEDFVTLGGKRRLKEGRVFNSMHEAVVGNDVRLQRGNKFIPVHGHRIEGKNEGHQASDDIEHHEHGGIEYVVVGRMIRQGTPWDRVILVPAESIWDIHGMPTGHHNHAEHLGPPWNEEVPGVPAIVVKPKTISDAYRIRNLYNTNSTIAIFPAEVLLKLYDVLGNIRDVMSGMSIVTQILIFLAIILTIFVTINNRRKQIAVLRAMGASPAYIFSVVWLYTVFLIFTGTLLGILFGYLSAHLLSEAFHAGTGLNLPVLITGQELILALSLIFSGMLIAVIPAWMSYRLPVAESLKTQE